MARLSSIDARIGVVCAVVSLALGASHRVAGAQTPSRARLDSVFGELGDHTPGASVAVVRDARPVFAAGFGMANLDHAVPVRPETVFDIASVSKQFAGMAVSMLVEAGRIDMLVGEARARNRALRAREVGADIAPPTTLQCKVQRSNLLHKLGNESTA